VERSPSAQLRDEEVVAAEKATPKATPKPTLKATTKATPDTTPKTTTKATAKATPKATPKSEKVTKPKNLQKPADVQADPETDIEISITHLVTDPEPASETVTTHDIVCQRLNDLKAKVFAFADSFPPAREDIDPLDALLVPGNQHLVRYIGYLALGGNSGEQSWRETLSNLTCRHALVSGVIGRALKEHVFDELCYGAAPEFVESLSKQEEEFVQQDGASACCLQGVAYADLAPGFYRTKKRANTTGKNESRYLSESALQVAVAQTVAQLESLVMPLWTQDDETACARADLLFKRQELVAIVEDAAKLSQTMRKDGETVYYWPPTFKDEEFAPERMECLNLAEMIRASPYDTKKSPKGYVRPVLEPGREHERNAVVRVVSWPGVVSYQQGGGELAQAELMKEVKQAGHASLDFQRRERLIAKDRGALTGNEGFRTRILCKSVVLLQWGTQRLLTKEAGTSRYIKAMKSQDKRYENDTKGCLELYDLFLDRVGSQPDATEVDQADSGHRSSWMPNVSRLFSTGAPGQ